MYLGVEVAYWIRSWASSQKVGLLILGATVRPLGKALYSTCSTLSMVMPPRGGENVDNSHLYLVYLCS